MRRLSGDAFSRSRPPTLAATSAPRGSAPTAPLSHQATTRPRSSGALDSVSGRVVWTARAQMGVVGLCQFLQTLRTASPTDIVLLVWDNGPGHCHPTVLAQAAALEIERRWRPTYAPWTNFIEQRWRWLKHTLLHHHHRADQWHQRKAEVAAFLDQFAEGSQALLRYVGALPDSVVKVHQPSSRRDDG